MASIEMHDIHKSFGAGEVLRGCSLVRERGGVTSIIGPSGSGKSTFLRCLCHLETIDRGTIRVDGEVLAQDTPTGSRYADAATLRRICGKMGMVFQQFNLFPHMTVLENLMIAPQVVQGRRKEDILPQAEAQLERVGLYAKRDVYPSRLSGGQKQRVAIARALVMEPEIMLFDEPTSALDPELTGEVLKTIQRLAEEKMTMIIVTHEMSFARRVADRVLFMVDGTVAEEGTPDEIFDRPQQERTQAFLSSMIGER